MSKKKIVILIDSLKTGGAQKQSALLAQALLRSYDVTLLVFDGRDIKQSFWDILKQNEGVNVKLFYCSKSMLLLKVFSFFKKHKPDIVFSYLPFDNLVNGLAGKLAGVKYRIGGIRNSYLEKGKLFVQKNIHNYFLTASISNSLAGKKSHIAWGQDKKPIFHLPNCYPFTQQPIQRGNNTIIKILSVGRFVDQKNYTLALEVVKRCKKILEDKNSSLQIEYNIIGYGELENETRVMINEFGLEKHVNLVLNPPNIDDYYENADIYLCTSKFEGLSNSIMEAMSFSLPIVATNVGGNPELISDGINGYITEMNVDYIVTKMMELVENYELRTTFGKNSYAIIKNDFSEEAFFQRYDSLIKNNFHPVDGYDTPLKVSPI